MEHLIALCQPFLADRCQSLRGVAKKKPLGLARGRDVIDLFRFCEQAGLLGLLPLMVFAGVNCHGNDNDETLDNIL